MRYTGNTRGVRCTEQRQQVLEQISVGLRSRRALGQSCSFSLLQSEFCLRGRKRTSGQQSCVSQKHVYDVGEEWYDILCQRQLIGEAELEQICVPGQESVES